MRAQEIRLQTRPRRFSATLGGKGTTCRTASRPLPAVSADAQGQHVSDFDTSARCLCLGRLNLHESAPESANRSGRTPSYGTVWQSSDGGPLLVACFVSPQLNAANLPMERDKSQSSASLKPDRISQEKAGINDLAKGEADTGPGDEQAALCRKQLMLYLCSRRTTQQLIPS